MRAHAEDDALSGAASFHEQFTALFETHFRRIYRILDRLSGEHDLAADLAQEAFVRLHRRGSMPDAPEAWVITVAMNLLRNARSMQARRAQLLTRAGREAAQAHASAPSLAGTLDAEREKRRVRHAVDALSERDRQLLLLRAEGYSYRDIAAVLQLHEASVGTLLARARRAFRELYEEGTDAPD